MAVRDAQRKDPAEAGEKNRGPVGRCPPRWKVGRVAGWEITPWKGSEFETEREPHMMWTAGEKPSGGSAGLPEEALARSEEGKDLIPPMGTTVSISHRF